CCASTRSATTSSCGPTTSPGSARRCSPWWSGCWSRAVPVDAVVGLPAHGAHGSARVAADLGWEAFAILVVLLLVAAALAQVAALRAAAPRGRWPWWRTLAWHAGLLCAGVALVGPLAMAARSSFTAHMAGHLLLGM